MDKKEEDQRMKELKDRYIRFDWAIKRLLRQKSNFVETAPAKSQLRCAGGFSHGFSWREDYHRGATGERG